MMNVAKLVNTLLLNSTEATKFDREYVRECFKYTNEIVTVLFLDNYEGMTTFEEFISIPGCYDRVMNDCGDYFAYIMGYYSTPEMPTIGQFLQDLGFTSVLAETADMCANYSNNELA